MQEIYQAIRAFWLRYPALGYGLGTLMSCWAALEWHWSLVVPACLLLPMQRRQLYCAAGLSACVFICCLLRFELPELPDEGIPGTAVITISSISDKESFMGKGMVLKGKLIRFVGAESVSGGDYRLTIPGSWKQARPSADFTYQVRGQLRSLGRGKYGLKVSKHTPWQVVGSSYNLTEWRYKAKKIASNYLKKSFKNTKVQAFLSGITIGEFSDKQTQNALANLGVQHLLAISGFHFALFAGLLSIALRTLLTRRRANIILLVALAGYFIFLGFGASITRAWLMLALALVAELVGLPYKGLNILGISLIVMLLWDPVAVLGAGFQLSFIAAGAILLLYPVLDRGLTRFFHQYALASLSQMTRKDQLGYLLICAFRQSLALILAVHSAVVPVSLYLFHSYPLVGLLANFFYPLLASISLSWLVMTLPLGLLIPPLGGWMHAVNNWFAESLLNAAYHFPPGLQLPIQADVPGWAVVIYLTLLVVIGPISSIQTERPSGYL